MKRAIMSCLAFVGLAVMLQADPWNKKTELTVSETIEVPGATLTPGKYVVKLMDSQSNRHIVQFFNEREDKVLSTVLAIPNERMKPTDKTEFSFYEAPAGEPRSLRAWFYPGDTIGHEFAYPRQKAIELARTSGQDVPSFDGNDPKSGQVTTVSPSETRAEGEADPPVAPTRTEPAVRAERQEPRPDPSILAQAPPPQERTAPREVSPSARSNQQPAARQVEEPSELPATGSPAPLLGLIGLLSLGGALGLRRLAKR